MKTTGRPPKRTIENRSNDYKKTDRKTSDKPKYSRSSDSKFKKSDKPSDSPKKRSYSYDESSGDKNNTGDNTYKRRNKEESNTDKPYGHNSDERRTRRDNSFSEKKPYKSGDKEKLNSDKPYSRFSDKTNRDGSRHSERKPYKSRDKEESGSDKPYSRFSDKTNRDGSRYSERKPYKSRDKEESGSDKPYSRFSDKTDRDNSKFSERKPYKSRDKEESGSDKPYSRFSDKTNRDDSKYSERKPYKARDKEESGSDKPYSRFSDKTNRDDSKYSERKPYKSRDKENYNNDKPYSRSSDKLRSDDSKFSDRKPYRSKPTENNNDRPVERYDNTHRHKDEFYSDKKPFKSTEVSKNDNDRPIEKYVYERLRIKDDVSDFSDSGKKRRPRKMESKNYTGRVHEYRETDILVKDNTYEKRRSFNSKSKEEGIRLNKFIANAGICSRREADILIEAGAISINGEIVTQLGTKVMPSDQVKYGDQLLAGEQLQYLLLNKPKDYITTTDDPQERKTVMLIIENACKERIYPVGRLDRNTSGLLLFTNDGELAKKLTHPKHQVEKVYHAELDKNLSSEDMKKIIDGIELEDGLVKIDAIEYGDTKKEIGIELHSGKNRIVRRIFETLGYEVVKLDRVVFAGLTKKEIPRGKYRFLSAEEINILRRIR